MKEEVEAMAEDQIVIIDEVQKIPLLLDVVHMFLAKTSNKRTFVLMYSW